jgi:MoxR-like ATPase
MPKDLAVQINDAIALLGNAKASMQRAFLRPRTDDRVDFDHDLIGGKYGLLVGFASLGKARLVDCLSHVLGLQGNAVQFTAYRVPSDILCSDVLEQSQNGTRQFCFLEGPFFVNCCRQMR